MQDPTAFAAATLHQHPPQFPEQEQLRCPRCDSTNTKFCYYNNYNLSQPRHFCKSCRRYWTKGGALRNIPVGGSTRKSSKRSSPTDNDDSPAAKRPSSATAGPNPSPSGRSFDIKTDPEPVGAIGLQLALPAGGFTSLLAASDGQFGSLLEEIGHGPGGGLGQGLVDGGCDWGLSGSGGGGGWPDLAIFTTPSSRLQ